MKVEEFTAEAFRPHVGSVFRITTATGETHDLILDEVKVVLEKHVSPRMKRDAFSLFFVGSATALPQHTYTVSHDALGGPWLLFLVPVARNAQGVYEYEAAFN